MMTEFNFSSKSNGNVLGEFGALMWLNCFLNGPLCGKWTLGKEEWKQGDYHKKLESY